MRKYYVCCDGSLRFTRNGIDVLGSIFELNGIDYRSIRTRRQFIDALLFLRSQCWIEDLKFIKASNHDQEAKHPDHGLVAEALYGAMPPQDFERTITKNKNRKLFTVV
ncbi:MAG: hypothetical protein GY938_11000 [Ketobacter sp.]|nr:hypothetical protein [Ketobacter sp.]